MASSTPPGVATFPWSQTPAYQLSQPGGAGQARRSRGSSSLGSSTGVDQLGWVTDPAGTQAAKSISPVSLPVRAHEGFALLEVAVPSQLETSGVEWMEDVVGAVVIGMDPHKRSATIEVMAGDGTVLGSGRYATDVAGYRAMLGYAKPADESAGARVVGHPN